MAIANIPATIITTLTKINQPTAFLAIFEISGSLIAALLRVADSRRAAPASLYHYSPRFGHIAVARQTHPPVQARQGCF
jgi:hypothetical protein